jgi:hypothetical protein
MRPTLALATLLVAGASAHAQNIRTDSTTRFHVLPALGVHIGTPQRASAALGIVVGEDFVREGRDHSRNIALFAEPGLGAGRASLAYVSHGYGSFGSGFGFAATALRTWQEPWQLEPNQTYVGGEVLFWPILFVGPRVGLLRNVSTVEMSRHWFWSLSFGIGL